jgi:hypothetical protein
MLFAAFALAAIAVLAYTVRRQFYTIKATHEHRMHLAEEVQELRRQLSAIIKVVERSGGGVEKRIREQQEIVAAIISRQPVLFNNEPGLKHWLNAQNVFLRELKSAVAGEHI